MAPKQYHEKREKTLKKSPNPSTVCKKMDVEIRNATEEYLSDDREEALGKLAIALRQPNFTKIRPILKKSILCYVSHYRKDFEGSIEINNCVYDMFRNFDMTAFVERSWQHRPYYIPGNEYAKLQTISKNPIHITNYDYSEPIYKLSNTIEYGKSLKLYKKPYETIRNDIKFYLSKDESVMCAKLICLKYRPLDLKAVKKHNKDKSAQEKEFAVYDHHLYNRSLSITMYALLDGDPNKAMPFLRYDSDPKPHNNIFIGSDKRREVFGEIAESPHFHFQNEEDSLLCLRKFICEDGKIKYKTGRCNAIDCKHLKKYLLDIDGLNQEEVHNLIEQNLDYGMPFLSMKAKGHKVGVSLDNLFAKFIEDKTAEQIELLRNISRWLKEYKNDEIYNRGGCFDKVIRTLDFLKLLSGRMDNTLDYETRKLYSQLEIFVSDSLVNVICNNSSKYLLQNQEPKYIIDTDLYGKIDQEKSE